MTDFYNVIDEPLGKTTFIDADDVAQRLRLCGYSEERCETVEHLLEYVTEMYQYGAEVHVQPFDAVLNSGIYTVNIYHNKTGQYDLDEIYTLACVVDSNKAHLVYNPHYYILFCWLAQRHKMTWPGFEAQFNAL